MEPSRTERAFSRWYVIGLSAVLLLCLVVLVRDILLARRRLREVRKENSHLVREILRLEEESQRLEILSNALESDPQTLERQLRRKIHLSRSGEKLIRFEEDETAD